MMDTLTGHIRSVVIEDASSLVKFLDVLDYKGTEAFIHEKLKSMLEDEHEYMFVYENDGHPIAFMSMHIIPQIALKGDFARISYFAVDEAYRNYGLGRLMEEHCVEIARGLDCDRIELHSNTRRVDAHRFYYRQGYEESPKYLMKKLK